MNANTYGNLLPKDLRDGMRVLYMPTLGHPDRFAGTVDGEPFELGGHTWCVHLKDMDPGYRNGRGFVKAAAVSHLFSAEAETP